MAAMRPSASLGKYRRLRSADALDSQPSSSSPSIHNSARHSQVAKPEDETHRASSGPLASFINNLAVSQVSAEQQDCPPPYSTIMSPDEPGAATGARDDGIIHSQPGGRGPSPDLPMSTITARADSPSWVHSNVEIDAFEFGMIGGQGASFTCGPVTCLAPNVFRGRANRRILNFAVPLAALAIVAYTVYKTVAVISGA